MEPRSIDTKTEAQAPLVLLDIKLDFKVPEMAAEEVKQDFSGMDLDNMLDALSDELMDDIDDVNLLDEEF
jgi:hypothetical protein